MGHRGWIIAGVIGVGVAVGSVILFRDVAVEEPRVRSDADSTEASPPRDRQTVALPSQGVEVERPDVSTDDSDLVEWDLAAARDEDAAASAALAEAQRELDDLEREVDAVERYVEDLIERGEDPAMHAEEGMEKLRPVIARYEARLEVVMAAEARAEIARAHLEAAQAAHAAQQVER